MSIKNYGAVESIDELLSYTSQCHGKVFGFDIETGYLGDDREKGSVHPETAIIVGISFSPSTDWARYVPLAHDDAENLDNYRVAQIFWDLLNTGLGVAHNAGFELRHLSKWFREYLSDDPERGEAVRASRGYFPVRSDTLVEAYLVAEFERFGLKPLTQAMFDHQMTELYDLFPDLAVNQRKYLRFNVLPLEPRVIEYACEDSVWCLAIHERYYPKVKDRLLYPVEMAIVEEVLPFMEEEGVVYDWAFMRRTADFLRVFKDRWNAELMTEFSRQLGKPVAFNVGSPKQVSEILYDQLGLRTTVYTPKTRDLPPGERKMSTSDIALRKIAKDNVGVRKILEWRNISKLLGTYLDKYEKQYNYADDGRAHPNLLSAFVRTGRFACSDPNYQQCLPGSYEVLTPDGWERLDKLADGVSVAQYHNDQRVDFVVPSAVVRDRYDGDLIEFDAGRTGRWRYTPNHRIVFRTRAFRGEWALSDIKELPAAQWDAQLATRPLTLPFGRHFDDRYMPCAGYTGQPDQLSEDALQSLRLAVAVQADGSRTKGHQYDISVHKDRKVERLRELGVEPQLHSGGRWRARIRVEQVSVWLDENKNFRPEAILKLHQNDLRAFLDEIMQWDGDAVRGARFGQKTTRRQSVDVVQAAAALVGRATSLYEYPELDHVVVNIHPRPHRDSGYQTSKRVPSDGMVYCVTVPTGMFLVRNDEGHVQVTGNSPKKYHLDLAEAEVAHATGEEPPEGTCFKFNFRDVITVPPEHYGLGFDLSQAELRAIAGEAQETALLEAFERGEDVHRLTASLMLGIALEEVTDEQRNVGKTMNFALLYGMSVKGLADRLSIAVDEAQLLMDKYFSGLSGIAAYMQKMVSHGQNYGYVTSKFGRHLPIWEYKSPSRAVRQSGDRACVNYPIQGAATGDYMKIAMVRAVRALRAAGLADRVKLVMNIHDALEFYVHKSVDPQDVIMVLQPAVIFPVPGWPAMKADWHLFRRWGSPMNLDVTADGTILTRPAVEKDTLEVEVDDEGNVIEVLPEVSEQALREAAIGPGRHVLVELSVMPSTVDWQVCADFMRGVAGNNTIELITPQGDVQLGFACGLRPEHVAEVARLLRDPGVRISYRADAVTELIDGLTL